MSKAGFVVKMNTDQMLEILESIADRLENSLIKREAKGRTITLKMKYFDFQSITRGVTIDESADSASVIMKYVGPLLSKTEVGEKKVRLLGISISNFDGQETNSRKVCKYRQLPLPFKFSNAKDSKNDFNLW
jgi:DNA polymerase-4